MSAIYQRARPIRWDQVVGQEHVKDVLKAALEQGRVGHAYLFSGPRGVGKTTTARLIAMTANCTGPLPKPCGECESCLSVRAGSHPDVLEIDAASNNSVDDVRDLREKVSLAAMRGGKKIYILDEAHMMSRAAFNALLKTLEEPPGHVIFILATTEPEKIIPTILSRCQHYRFRRLTPEEIAGKLAGLAQREGMNADADALHLIGRLADGAMRDGESLLERMLAAGTAITRPSVEEALGLPPGERVRSIAAALVVGDAGAALSGAAHLYRDGFAARTVVEGLVAAFGAALHAELGLGGESLEGADVPRLLKLQAALDEQESRFARSADQQSLELALTHALLAADGGGGSSAGGSAASVPTDLLQRLNRLEKELSTLRSSGARPAQAVPVADFDPTSRRGPVPVREVVQDATAQIAAPGPALQGNWADVVRQASIQVKAFLKPARMHAETGYVSLTYDDKNAFHAKQVAGKFDDLAKLVLKVFGPVTFELIAPEGGRKVKLGGSDGGSSDGGGGGGSATPNNPAPVSPGPKPEPAPAGVAPPSTVAETPAVSPVTLPPAPEIAPFEPAPRRNTAVAEPRIAEPRIAEPRAAETRGPQFEAVQPLQAAPSSAPVMEAAPTPRQSSVATLEPPALDAPPPRPGAATAAWNEDHEADQPFAEKANPAPAAPKVSRELYVVEAISEEPNWDDIGGPATQGDPVNLAVDLSDAPFANLSVERPAPTPPKPAPTPAAAPTTPARVGDIRAHPMYEDIKARFSGRVREIGKNRNPHATPAEVPEEGTPEEEAEAQAES